MNSHDCFNDLQLYALHDWDEEKKRKGAFPINNDYAKFMNGLGYGIHHSINTFYDKIRKAENIIRINYWVSDIDIGDKESQLKKIDSLILPPSIITETKKGFHCYWKARFATVENYKIIQEAINKSIGADEACKDITRLFRHPGFYHLKDKDNPFMVSL